MDPESQSDRQILAIAIMDTTEEGATEVVCTTHTKKLQNSRREPLPWNF